jgi:MFS family permease
MSDTVSSPGVPALRFLPLQMVFAFNGMGIALWFPRIPDVKAALEVDLFTLSICFFMMPVGTMTGFLFAASLARKFGTRRMSIFIASAFLLMFILPGVAWNAVTLGLALFLTGLLVASVEVGMNAKASEIETSSGRRIMTRCHAFWSFGSMTGALVGGAYAQAGVPFLTQQLIMEPLLALGTIWFALQLPADLKSEQPEASGLALPGKAILALCLLPMGALLVEGAIMEWSAIFLRENVGIDPWGAALTYSVFALSMGIGRMMGDGLAERFRTSAILIVSSLLATGGIFLFSLSPGLWLALPSALVLGAGVANIYPLAISAVAKHPGGSKERNVAAITFIAFMAFLIGPPLIGTLGSLLGLPVALGLLTPVAVYPAVVIWRGFAKVPETEKP